MVSRPGLRRGFVARLRSRALIAVATLLGLTMLAVTCSSGGWGGTTSSPTGARSPATTTTTPPQGGSTGQASSPNPCQLVTDSEASTLLGGTTQRTGPKEENGLVDCKWENSQAGFLLVALAQGAGFYDPELSNPGWKPVSGVGDKAFVDDATHTVGFIKGTTVVDLFVAFHTVPIADNVNLAVRWPAGSDRPGPLRRSRGRPTVGAFDGSISDYQPSA